MKKRVRMIASGFGFWVSHLQQHGYRDLVDEIDKADAMLAPSPCPNGRDGPLPTVYRPTGGG